MDSWGLLGTRLPPAQFVERIDRLYLTATGVVDLMAMSRDLSEEQFREYIECWREVRAAKRVVPTKNA